MLEEVDHSLRQLALGAQRGSEFFQLSAIRQLVVIKQVYDLLIADFDQLIDVITTVEKNPFSTHHLPETSFSGDDSFKTFGYNRHGVGWAWVWMLIKQIACSNYGSTKESFAEKEIFPLSVSSSRDFRHHFCLESGAWPG